MSFICSYFKSKTGEEIIAEKSAGMAAMIDTERRWLMRRPGPERVVRNVVSWRTVRGYDRPWRESSD